MEREHDHHKHGTYNNCNIRNGHWRKGFLIGGRDTNTTVVTDKNKKMMRYFYQASEPSVDKNLTYLLNNVGETILGGKDRIQKLQTHGNKNFDDKQTT